MNTDETLQKFFFFSRTYCMETFLSSCLTSKSQGTANFRFLIQESKQNGGIQTHACVSLDCIVFYYQRVVI